MLCRTMERKQHQAELRKCICSDVVRQHLYAVANGTVLSPYREWYEENIGRRGGVLRLAEVGFGPLADNEAEVWSCHSCVNVVTQDSSN